MQTPATLPEQIADEDLTETSGGGEYLAPGVYVEEVSFRTTRSKVQARAVATPS
ncbi:MAG: hypothetical protein AAF479_02700 [Pseudomonadota bacterium]